MDIKCGQPLAVKKLETSPLQPHKNDNGVFWKQQLRIHFADGSTQAHTLYYADSRELRQKLDGNTSNADFRPTLELEQIAYETLINRR